MLWSLSKVEIVSWERKRIPSASVEMEFKFLVVFGYSE